MNKTSVFLTGLAAIVACSPGTKNITNIEYPLKSVASIDSVSDPLFPWSKIQRDRVLKLANYAMQTTPSMHSGLKSYSNTYNDKLQYVKATMVIDNIEYSIVVGNYNEFNPKTANVPDILIIDAFPNLVHFEDRGLKGECDKCFTSTGFTEVPLSSEVPDEKAALQFFYGMVLDELIRFYESGQRK